MHHCDTNQGNCVEDLNLANVDTARVSEIAVGACTTCRESTNAARV